MIKKLRHKYNKWLFKKYGTEPGLNFSNIPFIFRLGPLFSPMTYMMYVGEELTKGWSKDIDKMMSGLL